ncbi:hypothetical protein [Bradyrhizobium sp. 45]|uniref:sensor histidine kinase n=1 Tax=Bradyrhizobium sp. 45 TaxID=1043587 RepID=UPI001FF855DE|nr:hypothetical protein [Bradyrhizobium sp. 45]MCK1309531.1 hypothetical protein [Bradyrhizobium sp. 45]
MKDLVADLVPEAARKGIDLGFQLIEPVAIKGEPMMVATMIRNLLDNAVRFTPHGGRVDIGVYRAGKEGGADRRYRTRHPVRRHRSDIRAVLPRQPTG